METWHWISLGVVIVGYAFALIKVHVNNQVSIAKMEAEINHIKEDFHSHEKMNEVTFDKIEKSIANVDQKLDKIYFILISK